MLDVRKDAGRGEASRVLPDVTAVVAQQIAPAVRRTASGAYPGALLDALGAAGAFSADGLDPWAYEQKRVAVIRTVARCCLATAFLVWCHTAAVVYVRSGQSRWLQEQLLPSLEAGSIRAGTGLSNAMKAAGGLDRLRVCATPTADGYRLSGTLPAVSNLGPGHWFGVVAATGTGAIAALVPVEAPGISLAARERFVGLNGTATYAVRFDNVPVPRRYVLSDDARRWLRSLRAGFLFSQLGLSLGLADDVATHLERRRARRPGLDWWAERLRRTRTRVERRAAAWRDRPPLDPEWGQLVTLRRDAGRLALAAAEAALVADGSAGYQAGSYAARRVAEAWFVAIVTPSLSQLEVERQGGRVS